MIVTVGHFEALGLSVELALRPPIEEQRANLSSAEASGTVLVAFELGRLVMITIWQRMINAEDITDALHLLAHLDRCHGSLVV